MRRLAILISTGGTGSNLQAIVDSIELQELQAKIAVVVSDSVQAQGVARAEKYGIPTEIVSKNDDLVELLKVKYSVDYVCLTGWKLIIPDTFIDAFPDRILNVHPGLIPNSPDGTVENPDGSAALWNRGKYTEKAIQNFLDSGSTYAGSTLHFLSHKFDFGPVLDRCFEKIESTDTVESLYDRLKKKEHGLYVSALKKLCNDMK